MTETSHDEDAFAAHQADMADAHLRLLNLHMIHGDPELAQDLGISPEGIDELDIVTTRHFWDTASFGARARDPLEGDPTDVNIPMYTTLSNQAKASMDEWADRERARQG